MKRMKAKLEKMVMNGTEHLLSKSSAIQKAVLSSKVEFSIEGLKQFAKTQS